MSVVIQVDKLSKSYRLGTIGGKRLVDDVNRWWAKLRGHEDPLSKVGVPKKATSPQVSSFTPHPSETPPSGLPQVSGLIPQPSSETLWALKDVSFEVQQGEVLGIIGRNGAGKSTLLKILSQVTAPTSGEVRVKGRIASLLEVGTGFHPELTGRENIFLNGAILGMTKAEIRGKFDEIVAFSEVEKFIDTPTKRYSSGMTVRLAFAVAAHLEPEILIVDEVLAVGDAAFQKRCLGKMQDVSAQGRTVLFVSHNMASVETMCSKGILLKAGAISSVGSASEVIAGYLSENTCGENASFHDPTGVVESVKFMDGDGHPRKAFEIGETIVVEITLSSSVYPATLSVGIGLTDSLGARVTTLLTKFHGLNVTAAPCGTRVSCRVEDLPLTSGTYGIKLVVGNHYENISVLNLSGVFEVLASDYYGSGVTPTRGQGYVLAKHSWKVIPS